jgi:NodT family efflux transporter outer membrane factor (OMF) lipoprotein
LVLAGCRVLPPESRLAEAGAVPGSWSAAPEARKGVDDDWVDRFGDGRLRALVAEAYASNRDLQAAAANVQRAVAAARGAGAAARPQLSLEPSVRRDAQNFIGFPIGGPGGTDGVLRNIQTIYGAQLGLSWELDLWGRVRAGEEAALADLQAQGQTYRGARASLAAQVVKSWLLLTELNGQVALAREACETRRDSAELIRGRFERATGDAGGSASQLRLAETDVATAEAALQARLAERDQAMRQLEILLGRYPSAALGAATELPVVKDPPPAGLPSELLLRRPDILAAERNLAAAGRRRDEAVRAFFPTFSLTSSGGRSTDQLRRIFDSDFGVWSIAGQLSQPILQGGRLKSQLATRDAEEKRALAELQQTVLDAFGEVEIALAADRFLARRGAAVAAAAGLSEEAAEAARRDFTLGTTDVLTLLTAETRRIDLVSQRLLLRRLRLENRVNLHLALGGDYRL